MALTKILITMSVAMLTNMSPIMMTISILMFSSLTMMMKWIETSSAWIPLIFTLAFLGGMMIIFMYIISISNSKNKKNKNKLPIVFVFVCLAMWNIKYGTESTMVSVVLSSFFSQYAFLGMLIVMILFITTKIINSPFKALKGAF